MYDPENARWTQQDPLDQADGLTEGNRYGYVGGDPINKIDLAGLSACDVAGPIGLDDECEDVVDEVEKRTVGCAKGVVGGFVAFGAGKAGASALARSPAAKAAISGTKMTPAGRGTTAVGGCAVGAATG